MTRISVLFERDRGLATPKVCRKLSIQDFCASGSWDRSHLSLATRQNGRVMCFDFLSISSLAARLGRATILARFDPTLAKSGSLEIREKSKLLILW